MLATTSREAIVAPRDRVETNERLAERVVVLQCRLTLHLRTERGERVHGQTAPQRGPDQGAVAHATGRELLSPALAELVARTDRSRRHPERAVVRPETRAVTDGEALRLPLLEQLGGGGVEERRRSQSPALEGRVDGVERGLRLREHRGDIVE